MNDNLISDFDDEMEEYEDTLKGKYLTFIVGKEDYGIEICYVTEIVGLQEITEVPELPAYVKGIINLRGTIIPVIDLRTRFKKTQVEFNDRTCIIIIAIDEISIGLIVDKVADVVFIPESNIVPAPDRKTGFNNRYIKGVGKVHEQVKLLIDCEELFTEEEVGLLSAI